MSEWMTPARQSARAARKEWLAIMAERDAVEAERAQAMRSAKPYRPRKPPVKPAPPVELWNDDDIYLGAI